MSIIKGILSNPYVRFSAMRKMGVFKFLPDDKYISKEWKAYFGSKIDLVHPKTLCEKIQWLKLNDRKPLYNLLVDKYEVKQYVEKRVGKDHIIPTLAVYNTVDEINLQSLPDKFVLKPTHDSGGIVICRDKASFDWKSAKKQLRKSLKTNYYFRNREWAYKDVKPRIIAEPLIEELGKVSSIEYKTTCFNGKVGFVTICTGIAHDAFDKRFNDHFDRNGDKMDWWTYYKPATMTPEKPKQWKELIEFCENLSSDIPYVRVDTYIVDDVILFGEMTFYTWGGFMKINPREWDEKLGEMLILPK